MEFLHRTWAEIDLSAVRHNLQIIKSKVKSGKIIAVVKADCYGHSAQDIAPVLEECGADMFAVSNIEEALSLRAYGINRGILILGYTPPAMVKSLFENGISQCVYSEEYACALSEMAVKENVNVKIHIKLDTGMSRIGFNCRSNELSELNCAIKCAEFDGFKLEGVFTHFAVSDRSPLSEDGFTGEQYARFFAALKGFKNAGLNPEICHCCNSAALLQDRDKHLTGLRPGIILYGLAPSDNMDFDKELVPVMTLKSVVSMVKKISEGNTVNYGRTFKAEKEMTVATVTAGYADGYPRLLSNKGYVLVNGQKAPIIGRICMDQFSVDISQIPDVKMGDEVILFGKELPVENVASWAQTINYEIVCGVSPRVPRIILNK